MKNKKNVETHTISSPEREVEEKTNTKTNTTKQSDMPSTIEAKDIDQTLSLEEIVNIEIEKRESEKREERLDITDEMIVDGALVDPELANGSGGRLSEKHEAKNSENVRGDGKYPGDRKENVKKPSIFTKIRSFFTNGIVLKLISLLAAVLLWLIVVNIDDPQVTRTITNIPVNVLDEELITEQNQIYSIYSGDKVSIHVTGPRSEVDGLTREDFVAQAPFSEKSNVNAVPIYVSFRNSKYEKNCSIVQKDRTMILEVENILTKTFEIGSEKSGSVAAGYTVGKERLSPTTVTLKAPESIINAIDRAGVKIDLAGHTEDFSEEVAILFYNANGSVVNLNEYCELSTETTNASIQVLTIKEVPLKFGSTGTVAEGYELVSVTGNKQTVKIAGYNVNLIDAITFPDELVDVEDATADVVVEADVPAQLTSGIMLVDESDAKITVTAKVEELVTKTYRLPISAIDIHNLPEDMETEFGSSYVNVSVTALQSVQNEFTVSDVKAYVDLKNVKIGDNEVLVHITLPEGLKLTSEVIVNVNMASTRPETTEQDSSTEQSSGTSTAQASSDNDTEQTDTTSPQDQTVQE